MGVTVKIDGHPKSLCKVYSFNNYYQCSYLENRGMVSLSGCVYLLARGDGTVGKAGLSPSSRHNSKAFTIGSSAYAMCVKMNNTIHSAHTYVYN